MAHRRRELKSRSGRDLIRPELLAAPGADDDVGLAPDDLLRGDDPLLGGLASGKLGKDVGAAGRVERSQRVIAMIDQADAEGFGSCSNEGECEAVCPKEIPISNIARMTREYIGAVLTGK